VAPVLLPSARMSQTPPRRNAVVARERRAQALPARVLAVREAFLGSAAGYSEAVGIRAGRQRDAAGEPAVTAVRVA
jgi:hypothetical protein